MFSHIVAVGVDADADKDDDTNRNKDVWKYIGGTIFVNNFGKEGAYNVR